MTSSRASSFALESSWRPLLKDLRVDARAVLRRADLPEDLLSREGAALPTPEYFRLWEALEAEIDDPSFPVRMADVIQSESFHPLVFAALCSSSFSVAARRIAQYKRLVAPMEMIVTEDESELELELRWLDRSVRPPASLAAFELAFFVKLVRLATREPVKPLRAESKTPLRPVRELSRYLGVRPKQTERYALALRASDARRPFLTANEGMWAVFEPALRRRLTDLDATASFADRVRSALLEGLPGGESSMEDVARKLAVSKRTLQRRLRDEATTFQAVLTSTREELARNYLTNTELSGAEISYLLGFENPNSFFRAFHSWTGKTTEQVRFGAH